MGLTKGSKYKVNYIVYQATFSGGYYASERSSVLTFESEDLQHYNFKERNHPMLKSLVLDIQEIKSI